MWRVKSVANEPVVRGWRANETGPGKEASPIFEMDGTDEGDGEMKKEGRWEKRERGRGGCR